MSLRTPRNLKVLPYIKSFQSFYYLFLLLVVTPICFPCCLCPLECIQKQKSLFTCICYPVLPLLNLLVRCICYPLLTLFSLLLRSGPRCCAAGRANLGFYTRRRQNLRSGQQATGESSLVSILRLRTDVKNQMQKSKLQRDIKKGQKI